MRDPKDTTSTVISSFVAKMWAALALILLLWIGFALFRVEFAYALALWVVKATPLEWNVPAEDLARVAVRGNGLASAASAAFVSLVLAAVVWGNRRRMEPNEIVFKSQPCMGKLMEGSLRLYRQPSAEDTFNVRLECQGPSDDGIAFSQEQTVKPISYTNGWEIPFQFHVPAKYQPVTGLTDERAHEHYVWRVITFQANQVYPTPITFPVTMSREGRGNPHEESLGATRFITHSQKDHPPSH